MTKLKKIGVLSAAKIEGLICLVMGLILAVVFAVVGAIVGSVAGLGGDDLMGMFGGGIFAIIFIPIFYGVIGFIAGAIGAAIYNLAAKWMGGIEIELENK